MNEPCGIPLVVAFMGGPRNTGVEGAVTNHVVPLIKPQCPPPTVLRGVGLVGCPHGQIPFLHSWTLCRFCLQIGAELTVNQWP